MEAFLLQLIPELASTWGNVTDEEIDRVEAKAGRTLPTFYRWFLGRFGKTMGPLAYRDLDFSCAGILRAYAEGWVEEDPRYLLIAYSHDPAYPAHVFYDLDCPVREDALVVSGEDLDEEELDARFETLREMIGWGALFTHGVRKQPQRCAGMFRSPQGDAMPQLRPALESLGFTSPIATGRSCGVFRGPKMDLVSKSTPEQDPELQAFDFGAVNATVMRRALGEVVEATELELKILRWDPALG